MSDNSSDIAYYTYSPICGGGNDFNGRLGLHIAAVFIILVTSTFGISRNTGLADLILRRGIVSDVGQKDPSTPYS